MHEKDITPLHLEYNGIHIRFEGYSPFGMDELISWGFVIDHGDPSLVTSNTINELKSTAKRLGEYVQIEVTKRFGKSIESLLLEEGFEHWIDGEEDDGYWWPADD
jgi:hypothetical protein